MRLRKEGKTEYWELSDEERRAVQGEVVRRPVAPDRQSHRVPASRTAWSASGEGIVIHDSVTEELATRGFAVISNELVWMSGGLSESLVAVRERFCALARPSFGHQGAAGFFAGRQLLAFEAEFREAETLGRANREGFLASLFKAVIRVLPGYDSNRRIPLSWIFSRHDHDVDAMPFHKDSVGWLAQFNIDRTCGIHGGSIELRDGDGEVVVSNTLSGFLDGYIVRDSLFDHGTTGIVVQNPGVDHRDVVVIRLPLFDE